ncbi:hypothetical protein ABPG72_001397 [Tetrahymena utriculariae]
MCVALKKAVPQGTQYIYIYKTEINLTSTGQKDIIQEIIIEGQTIETEGQMLEQNEERDDEINDYDNFEQEQKILELIPKYQEIYKYITLIKIFAQYQEQQLLNGIKSLEKKFTNIQSKRTNKYHQQQIIDYLFKLKLE